MDYNKSNNCNNEQLNVQQLSPNHANLYTENKDDVLEYSLLYIHNVVYLVIVQDELRPASTP